MFGLSMRERVQELMNHTMSKKIDVYKDGCREAICSVLENGRTGKDRDTLKTIAMFQYAVAVREVLEGVIEGAPAAVSARYTLATSRPKIAGVPKFQSELPVLLFDSLYCVIYYSFTGKPGKKVDAEQTKQMAEYFMEKAYEEVLKEYPETR